MNGKILESITPEEFHLAENINENPHKKSCELTKKRHIRKFNELISKNKVTQSATNIKDKKEWVINMLFEAPWCSGYHYCTTSFN